MTDITQEQMRERLGNIDQIRDLLFGHKVREYEQRFEQSEHRLTKLELEFSKFQEEVRARLNQLQTTLSNEIHSSVDSFEKKLKYLSLTTQEETGKIQQMMQLREQQSTDSLQSLQKGLTLKVTSLQDEVSQTREKLQDDFQGLKKQVFEEIEEKFTNLKEGKISRNDFAELLFDLCFKLKGNEVNPVLSDHNHPSTSIELLLPESTPEASTY